MVDLKINFSNINEDAQDFSAAALNMVNYMEEAMASVQTASADLSGNMQIAAQGLYATMHANNHAMAENLQAASNILDQMAGILQNADILAAAGFSS